MMRPPASLKVKHQGGYLLLSLLVGTTAGVFVVLALITAALGKARERELERALTEAASIAQVADANDRRITGSVQDPVTQVYSYTHGTRSPAYRTVNVLNADYGLQLPVTSPYGTPYQYLNNGNLAIARFDIPAADFVGLSIDPIYFREVLAGGVVRVYAQAVREPTPIRSRRLAAVKQQMYLETSR